MRKNWTQLEGVEQILPDYSWELEQKRRSLLDCLYRNGYELVVPPLADFLESLLCGTNGDLDVLTVKSPDHMSGRLFGIRADMTPQVAQIAAMHMPVQETSVRLCYFGSTLLARPLNIGGTREQLQYGAELFGSESPDADCEVIRLMVETLRVAGAESVFLSMGHVGIFDEIYQRLALGDEFEEEVLSILQRKSKPDFELFAKMNNISDENLQLVLTLTELNGSIQEFEAAQKTLIGLSESLDNKISEFALILKKVSEQNKDLTLHFDFAQVGGYRYHTGVVFSAYVPGYGQAVSKGGRYDSVMSAYGTPCPATGFSGDLKLLLQGNQNRSKKPILVQLNSNPPDSEIEKLFAEGERIIQELPGENRGALLNLCDRVLVQSGQNWSVQPII